MSVIPEGHPVSFREEIERAREVVERYPKGLFCYWCYDENTVGELGAVLTEAMPQRLIVLREFYFYPADLGYQIADEFFGWSVSELVIKQQVSSTLDLNKEVVGEFLPEFHKGEDYLVVGGEIVEIAGSDEVLTTEDKYARRFSHFRAFPNLKRGVEDLYIDSDLPDEIRRLYFGHVDLLMTGCQVNGVQRLYMDELLYKRMDELGLHDATTGSAMQVDHSLVARMGLNVKYEDDGVALVPSLGVLDTRLIADLESIGMRIVELGEDQFSDWQRAGVKCKSLNFQWRSGIES